MQLAAINPPETLARAADELLGSDAAVLARNEWYVALSELNREKMVVGWTTSM